MKNHQRIFNFNRYDFVKYVILIVMLLVPTLSFTQDEDEELTTAEVIDSLYREDQFYVGVTFNLLSNGPRDFSQNGLSAGLQAGFIRDFPINTRRNKALGIGLGLAIDTYNQNLLIDQESNSSKSAYSIIGSGITGEENRFTYYTLQMPIEYRWRTSTPTKYAFWRIHTGLRLGYIFRFTSSFIPEEGTSIRRSDIPEVNNFQYGPYFSFGYGAFNFQAYYGLNTLFSQDALIDDQEVNLQVIRLGLVFYFL